MEKVDSGRIRVDKAYYKIKREQEQQEEIRKAESVPTISKTNFNDRCKLFNNDFRQVKVKEIADNSIQLIFADPPYERKYLPIFDDLAKFAARTLVPGGSIITYLRQYDIPTILHYLENAGLNYYWIASIKLQGQFARAKDKHIVIKQKSLAWYFKGKIRKPRPDVDDLVESKTPSEGKKLDRWAQSPVEAEHYILRLTSPDDTVLDPMMGKIGTTGIVALKLKRKFIGIEINKKTFTIAKSRLSSLSYEKL